MKGFLRYEKIDSIINDRFPLYNKYMRQAVFHARDTSRRSNGDLDIEQIYQNAIEYYLDLQSRFDIDEYKCSLIEETLGISRFVGIDEVPDISKSKIKDLVNETFKLLNDLSKLKSGEVHQLWMETRAKQQAAREATVISAVQKTYAVHDLVKWLSMDAWTIEEAAALSMRIEPEFAVDLPKNFDDYIQDNFSDIFNSRVEIIRRALSAKVFKNDVIMPKIFEKWAKSKGYVSGGITSNAKDNDFNTNTKHKIYGMMLSMAFRHYSVMPVCGLKWTAKGDLEAIERDCRELGFDLSDKTIRKYFDEAMQWAAVDHLDQLKRMKIAKP